VFLYGEAIVRRKRSHANALVKVKRRGERIMNDPSRAGIPPSVEGVLTRPSSFSVEETLEHLREAIQSRNLTLFAHIDHSGEAKRVDLKMQEAHVLIFGNPKVVRH
jgi:hypothetical protein